MDQSLKEYADALANNGLSVYYPENASTYFWFSDGENIGYVQIERTGFSFSTVHRPNPSSGTGFQVEKHVYPATIWHALNTFMVPNWAFHMPRPKYRGWNQFQSEHWQTLIQHSV